MDIIEVSTDTCDGPRCGARAYVYVQINDRELAYCGSHGRAYKPELLRQGAKVIDLTHTIPA